MHRIHDYQLMKWKWLGCDYRKTKIYYGEFQTIIDEIDLQIDIMEIDVVMLIIRQIFRKVPRISLFF